MQETQQAKGTPYSRRMAATTERFKAGTPIRSLAALLELAVADSLEKVLLDPQITPSSSAFHAVQRHPSDPSLDKCRVCLAGALVVGTLRRFHTPVDFGRLPGDQLTALLAIDQARQNRLCRAYTCIGWSLEDAKMATDVSAKWDNKSSEFVGNFEFEEHLLAIEKLIPLLQEFEAEPYSVGHTRLSWAQRND